MTWSNKYKKSINCKNPKGFSQKAHCAGRTKRARGSKTKSKPVRFNARSSKKGATGLTRWFAEEWVDVCTGKPCGRKKYSKKGMPYCRPKRRVNKGTPRTARSLTREQKRKMCSNKRKNPTKRMKKTSKRKYRMIPSLQKSSVDSLSIHHIDGETLVDKLKNVDNLTLYQHLKRIIKERIREDISKIYDIETLNKKRKRDINLTNSIRRKGKINSKYDRLIKERLNYYKQTSQYERVNIVLKYYPKFKNF